MARGGGATPTVPPVPVLGAAARTGCGLVGRGQSARQEMLVGSRCLVWDTHESPTSVHILPYYELSNCIDYSIFWVPDVFKGRKLLWQDSGSTLSGIRLGLTKERLQMSK